MNAFHFEKLAQQARDQVSLHENEWLSAWSEIRAGHKNAMKGIVQLLKDDQITYDESTILISFATEIARGDSDPRSLFDSGSISERTYRMITGQYGSLDPLK